MPGDSLTTSPSASTILLPFLNARSRRGSLASIGSRAGVVDRDVLAHALDDIHSEASRSDALTSFHDFDGEGSRGPKELVSSGVTGLYNRLKQSVGASSSVSSKTSRPKSSESRETPETASLRSTSPSLLRFPATIATKKPNPDAASPAALGGPASPIVHSTSSNGDARDVKQQPHKLHTADAQPTPSVRSEESGKKSPPELQKPKQSKAAQDAPTREDVDKARAAWVEGDRSEVATDMLARVLSHREVAILDHSDPGYRRVNAGVDNESAIDDSDYADELDIPAPLREPSKATLLKLDTENLTNTKPSQLGAQRPPIVRVGASHLPGFEVSQASSTTDGADAASVASFHTAGRRPALEPSPNINAALQRRRTGLKPPPGPAVTFSISSHLKRRVLSKEFWMKDDNAKVCFSCGQNFSTFRRKHHCRTCGQIFDAGCTTLVPGRPFGQPNPVRLCKPCEGMIFGDDDDDSSVFSDDGDEYNRSPLVQTFSEEGGSLSHLDGQGFSRTDTEVTTPSIGIPVSRRNREAKRRSAVLEFGSHPALTRPSSSHSLVSLSRRPRSSSHRRRHSRHQPGRSIRSSIDIDRGPFHQDHAGDLKEKPALPTFHNDNIIDPDLAAYLSDEGSDDDDHPSILSAVTDAHGTSPGDREKLGFSSLFASALRKGRSKTGEKGTLASSTRGLQEDDTLAYTTRHLPKTSRNRDINSGSLTSIRASPQRNHSNLLLKTMDADAIDQRPSTPIAEPRQSQAKVVCASALHTLHSRNRDDVELYPASYEHVKKMLSQLLRDAEIAGSAAWEKALMPILMQCTDDVEPDVQQGDDMDIRHYIKLKKVPGGKPADTSYVSGIVFSKNVALKTMSRSISNPRIAIIAFAIEYARHEQHFMSLEPVIAQEQEYLTNLVNRIAALQPHVLLVQRHVSGLALQLLKKAGITVAYNIKESVLAAVARVTQTTMIRSVDKLGIDPSHLGFCESFEVKTFVTENRKKNYIYLSGCEPDLGCTLVLRGADTKTLRSIKRITEFMCYVAYNLKLENYLMRDEFVSIPHTAQSQIEAHDDPLSWRSQGAPTLGERRKSIWETVASDADHSNVHFKYEELEKDTRKRILSASPFVVFMQPYILTQLRDLERRLATYKMLRDKYAEADEEGEREEDEEDLGMIENFRLVQPEMVNAPPSKDQPKAVREFLHAVHDAQYEKAKHTYDVQERQWESFINGEVNPFDPFSHQKIVVLYSTVSSITSAPCTGPELLGIGFYAGFNRVEPDHDEDIPFGQYIEDLCFSANATCKDCNKKMHDHHRQYVHGYGQLSVSIQRSTSKLRGYANTILMWSTCRVCRHETTVTQMSDHTWKYSFAKYLELSFWSSPLHPRAGVCKHDIHRDFLRCFGFQDMVVRFQYDAIDIYDVIAPRGRVAWKVEADLTVKNEQYQFFEQRLEAFTNSIHKRLDSITLDTLDEKKSQEAHALLAELKQKAEDDHDELLAKLQRKYASSRYFELIPLNRALRFMDEKAIAWDQDFSNFERDYFPSETDIRKIAQQQLRNMFLESQPPNTNGSVSDISDSEDITEMVSTRKPGLTIQPPVHDIALSEKAENVLSSAVEAHKAANDNASGFGAVQENAIGRELTPVASPRQDQEEAVEREDVRHLDLAISSRSPETPASEDRTSMEESPAAHQGITERKSPDEAFAPEPKPLSSGLLDRIEQIRNSQAGGQDPVELSESKIPRLADLQKRDASPGNGKLKPSPPPLLRAQSQPGHVPRVSSDLTVGNSLDSVVANDPPDTERVSREKRLADRLGVGRLASKVSKVAPSFIPRSIPHHKDDKHSSHVSALAKHFEQMSREFEKERLKERRQRAMRSRQARANPLASSTPVVEVYENATDAVGEKSLDRVRPETDLHNDRVARQQMEDFVAQSQPEDNSAVEQDVKSLNSVKSGNEQDVQSTKLHNEVDAEDEGTDAEPSTASPQDVADPTSSLSSTLQSPIQASESMELIPELTIPEHRRNVWFKYLAEFWSKRSASGWANLEYPLHNTEHVFEDSDIIVREDEPSSVIALSLACKDYRNKVKDFRSHPSKPPLAKNGHAHKYSQNGPLKSGEELRVQIEASLLNDTRTHIKYSFEHGQVKASCKIFFAESFDALRRKCDVADRFMESMSRCLKFDSKGGKTKSLFLRTLDNRFIIKSLQEVEVKAFNRFAPDYFNFMSYALFHGVPSVIAKMFGLFQVNIRNPATGVDFSYYLLVMENLFYGRSPDRRFDLKGSMRNRKIEKTGQADEVLLDENLVETIFESPLFVREHSRKLLQASVFNDTLWLCKQNVMDYSLMAGFDDERKELVVGIIDCIRTYTWDKKLESWIKDRGKNKPTITSPKDYRNRFRVSMMQYVLQAPNCWHQFQAQMAPPKTLKEPQEREAETQEGETGEMIEGEKV